MSAEHEDLRILPGAVRQLEDKIERLEYLLGDEAIAERKRNSAAFSDEQSRRLDEIVAKSLVAFLGSDAFASRVDKQLEYNAGRQALRFILWVVCSFMAGATAVAVAWFKSRG